MHEPTALCISAAFALQQDLLNKVNPDLLFQDLQQTCWSIILAPSLQEIKPQSSPHQLHDPFDTDEKMTDAPLFTMAVNDALASMIDDITQKLYSLALSRADCDADVQNLEGGLCNIKALVEGLMEETGPPHTTTQPARTNSPFTEITDLREVNAARATHIVGRKQSIVPSCHTKMPTQPQSPMTQHLESDVTMRDDPTGLASSQFGWTITNREAIDALFVPGRVTDTVSQPLANLDVTFSDGQSVRAEIEGMSLHSSNTSAPFNIFQQKCALAEE